LSLLSLLSHHDNRNGNDEGRDRRPPHGAVVLRTYERSEESERRGGLRHAGLTFFRFLGFPRSGGHAVDITYIPTADGWLYLAVVEDLFSRMIVGWSMAETMTSRLVVDALDMAVRRRLPGEGLVAPSDRGSQYGCTPGGVGPRRREVSVQDVLGHSQAVPRVGGAHERPRHPGPNPMRLHESRHRVLRAVV